MEEYLVPQQNAESEFTEKRSRFIGRVWNVTTEEEAIRRIKETKSEHYDARHNCYCYIIKDSGVVRYSDDGEPQGTAGMPMLNVFQREKVYNVCCTVTRYFGGILLGAGGLTRAYARSAKDALDAAGIGCMRLWTICTVTVPYPLFEQIKIELSGAEAVIEDVQYTDKITIIFAVPDGALPPLQSRMTELSAGALTIEKTGEVFRPGPYIK